MLALRLGMDDLLASRSETQYCCIVGLNPLFGDPEPGSIPGLSGQSEFGTTLASEDAVSFNRRKASLQLSEVVKGLNEIVGQLTKEEAPQLLTQNTMQALRLILDTQVALNTAVEDLPVGEQNTEKRVRELKTNRGRQKQTEILQFILQRVQSDGILIPVSTKEIIEHTSLRSKSHVSQVLSGLIRDGKIVSYHKAGYSGYLPTQRLIRESGLERAIAEMSQ